MPPRSMWKGSISFGLVNIPVKLYTAVSQKDIRFNQLHAKDGARIRYKKFCSVEEKEVPAEEIVKGYEVSPDRYVTFTPEELDAADPVATHTIDIEDFVDLPAIDPIYFEHPYHLVPDKAGQKAYALFVKAMEKQDKVAIGRVVMHDKESLVALRVKDERILMSTMLFPDEIVDASTIEEGQELPEPSAKEVKMAEQLVEALSAKFDPTKYHDTHREKVLALIEKKAAGEEIVVEPTPKAKKTADLVSALEASLKAAKGRGKAGKKAEA